MFLVGLLLAAVGMVPFLPSESAVGADGMTLREISIVLAAIGLAMLIAGPVIRLPLQSWANYAACLGQVVCFAGVVWFTTVFPADWSVETGSRPAIVVCAAGIGIILLGGVLAPLIAGATREDLGESEGNESRHAAELESLYTSQAQFELYQDSGGK